MATSDTLRDFLANNHVDDTQWAAAEMPWELLHSIGVDHDSNRITLEATAKSIADVLQSIDEVHSVRWRVKSADHLMEKIVRKRASSEEREKYKAIDKENYFEIVTDLIGVRALHLFKSDWVPIVQRVRETYPLAEDPTAYIRSGDIDQPYLVESLKVKTHPEGYRSIHCVINNRAHLRPQLVEMQARTIFEEGWSEIDHRVRYPNFSKDSLIALQLAILNRMAGSADEMGTLVSELATHLDKKEAELNEKRKQIEEISKQLSSRENADAKTAAKLSELQKALDAYQARSSQQFVMPMGLGSLEGVGNLGIAAGLQRKSFLDGLVLGLGAPPQVGELAKFIGAGGLTGPADTFKI